MFKDNLYAIHSDLCSIENSNRDLFNKKVEEKISNNLDLYREKIEKTFKYMIDVNMLANQESFKKLIKKEGLK